jgi:uncharacterized glyoxalase superfamily protein PhnB
VRFVGEDSGREAPFRLGLRVADVVEAAAFYAGLGFDRVAELPGADGRPVMAILRRGDLQLLVDALVGMPFPDSSRERRTQAGPRGLGVAIGIQVDDVDAAARYCEAAGCEVTTSPTDAAWGERYAECVDPYGYAWKLFRAQGDGDGDGIDAVREAWFGQP